MVNDKPSNNLTETTIEESVSDSSKLSTNAQLEVKEIKVIRDKFTDRSKGFGFAELETDEQVQKAIDTLDGYEIKDRKLKVNRARKMESRFDKRGGSNQFRK